MKIFNSRREITLRNLCIFTFVVLLSGWTGQVVNVVFELPPEENMGMLLWLTAPLFTSLFLRAFAGDGWKDTGIKPLFRDNIKWYVFSLIIFPVLTILIIFFGYLWGWIQFSGFNIPLFLQAFAISIIPNFFKNIPEEFVWRGYLTPKLASLKIHDFQLYLIVGLVWGLWHIPYYLFFLDKETLQAFISLGTEVFILMTIVTMIAWSIVFVEIWILTRSIWPAVLMHTVEDAFINPLVLDSSFQISGGKDYLIHPVAGIFSIAVYTFVGLTLRRVRIKKGIRQN